MPLDGDLDGLVVNVGRHRRRSITLVQDGPSWTEGPSGYWLATDTADYIVVDPAASPSRRAVVICHEIAHILLGHHGDPATSDLIAVTAANVNPALVGRFLGRHAYASVDEQEAEEMASVLAAERSRRERAAQLHRNTISARLR